MKKRLTNWFPLICRQVSASIALSCWSFSWRNTSSAPMKWTASICNTVSIYPTWNPEALCQPAHPNTNQYSQTSILTSFHLNKRELGYGNSSGVWKSLQRLGITPKLQPTHWKRSSQKSRNPFRWRVPALSSKPILWTSYGVNSQICHDLMSSIPFLVSLAKASNGKLVAHATFLVKVSHCGVANFSDLETPLEQMSSGSNIPGSWRALWKPSKSSSPADSRVEWKQKLQLQMANKCKQYTWICVRRE